MVVVMYVVVMYGTYSLPVHKQSLQEAITLPSLAEDTKSIVKLLAQIRWRVLTFRNHGRTITWIIKWLWH